jgi:two-component system, OmpR family, alkaline phosphatase synthesis response regulator PhoP
MKKVIEQIINELEKVNKEVFTKSDIKTFLRLKVSSFEEQQVEIADMLLIPSNHEVISGNKRYILPKKQFNILKYLMINQNKCISREILLKNCWEEGVIVDSRTIDVHICKIKKILNPKLKIHSQKGVGYKLESNEV